MRRAPVIRAALPGYLCPGGFEPLADWLASSDAPPDVWRALHHAQTGAVRLRDCAQRALTALDALERATVPQTPASDGAAVLLEG